MVLLNKKFTLLRENDILRRLLGQGPGLFSEDIFPKLTRRCRAFRHGEFRSRFLNHSCNWRLLDLPFSLTHRLRFQNAYPRKSMQHERRAQITNLFNRS